MFFYKIRKNHVIFKILNSTLIDLPSPINISNFWNFGSSLGLIFFFQLMTGLILASHYCSNINLAFESLIHIMNDVNYGWLFRIIHLNGASFFFLFIFLHIGRGLYFQSFFFKETWNIGVIILFLSMLTAFIGYVLPWGQMSFWGATVITNLISAIPIFGKFIVQWVWGGFSVGGATLSRFFMLHFLMPFILAILIILHIFFLHETGSNNPSGLKSKFNFIPFHHYFSTKDMVFFFFFLLNFQILVFLFPFFLGDPENFILANSLVTPVHIVPEWYFLFAYAILRAIPNKFFGVLALIFSIMILFFPSIKKINITMEKTMTFNLKKQFFFWLFISSFFILTWIGGQLVEEPFISIGQFFVIFYFLFFFLMF